MTTTRSTLERVRSAMRCAALLATLISPFAVHAQANEILTPDMRTRLEAAEQRLNLTPDQRTQLHTIVKEEAGRLYEIESRHEDDTSRATRRALFAEARTVQEDFRARLTKLLSAEQMAEWDRIRKESIPELRKRLQAKKAGAPGAPAKP